MVGISTLGIVNRDLVDLSEVPVEALSPNRARALAKLYASYVLAPAERSSESTIPKFPVSTEPMGVFSSIEPYCASGYCRTFMPEPSRMFELALHRRTRRAALIERLLATDPAMKARVESRVNGRILGFDAEGMMSIQPYNTSAMASVGVSANPMAGTIMDALFGMDQAIVQAAGRLGAQSIAGGSFYGFVGAGFAGIASGFDNSGAFGGQGFGSLNPDAAPGNINNTNPTYEAAHQSEIAQLLADPSLTVEDKVTLMIMTIMNKMDSDIERQAQYVNSIQQQQASRTNGSAQGTFGLAAGTPITNAGGTDSPSIDVETLKLKRMIDKRSQMFDMLRQIIDKYNMTAKGIIDSIGR